MVCRSIALFDTEDKAVAIPNASNASASEPLTEIQQPLLSVKVLHLRWPHSLHPNVPILFRMLRPTGAEARQNSSGGGAMEFSSC